MKRTVMIKAWEYYNKGYYNKVFAICLKKAWAKVKEEAEAVQEKEDAAMIITGTEKQIAWASKIANQIGLTKIRKGALELKAANKVIEGIKNEQRYWTVVDAIIENTNEVKAEKLIKGNKTGLEDFRPSFMVNGRAYNKIARYIFA